MQATLETAIEKVTGQTASVTGSGRTDAGAHACHQVIAFSTDSALSSDSLRNGLNAHLPADVRVASVWETETAFHPRFDATSRVYRYLIWNREPASPFWNGRAAFVRQSLDGNAMNEAAQLLVGEHDFSAFVASAAEGPRARRMLAARVWREGDLVVIELEATGFMQQMARAIAGTLIGVGRGRLAPSDVGDILISRDRSAAGDTAPACGLYLADVRYPVTRATAATAEITEETE